MHPPPPRSHHGGGFLPPLHFTPADLDALHDAIDAARRNVWAEQPAAFLDRATIDMGGTLVGTTGS